MRGGPTDATLVIADASVSAPPIVSRAWSALAMHPSYFPSVAPKLAPEAVVLANTTLFSDPIAGDRWRVYGVPATQLASECGSALAGAIALIGAFACLTGVVSLDALLAGLAASLPERRRQHRELNERALRAGFAALPEGIESAWPKERAA